MFTEFTFKRKTKNRAGKSVVLSGVVRQKGKGTEPPVEITFFHDDHSDALPATLSTYACQMLGDMLIMVPFAVEGKPPNTIRRPPTPTPPPPPPNPDPGPDSIYVYDLLKKERVTVSLCHDIGERWRFSMVQRIAEASQFLRFASRNAIATRWAT